MLYKRTLKPYVLNAFYTWSIDLGFTPLIEVQQNKNNQVPQHLLEQDSIIFNIHPNVVKNLVFGKDHIEFQANFNKDLTHHQVEQIIILHSSILKVCNREDKYGLNFDIEENKKIKPVLTIIKNEEEK